MMADYNAQMIRWRDLVVGGVGNNAKRDRVVAVDRIAQFVSMLDAANAKRDRVAARDRIAQLRGFYRRMT